MGKRGHRHRASEMFVDGGNNKLPFSISRYEDVSVPISIKIDATTGSFIRTFQRNILSCEQL